LGRKENDLYCQEEEFETVDFKNEKLRQILDTIRDFEEREDLWECINVIEDIEELAVEGLNLIENQNHDSLL